MGMTLRLSSATRPWPPKWPSLAEHTSELTRLSKPRRSVFIKCASCSSSTVAKWFPFSSSWWRARGRRFIALRSRVSHGMSPLPVWRQSWVTMRLLSWTQWVTHSPTPDQRAAGSTTARPASGECRSLGWSQLSEQSQLSAPGVRKCLRSLSCPRTASKGPGTPLRPPTYRELALLKNAPSGNSGHTWRRNGWCASGQRPCRSSGTPGGPTTTWNRLTPGSSDWLRSTTHRSPFGWTTLTRSSRTRPQRWSGWTRAWRSDGRKGRRMWPTRGPYGGLRAASPVENWRKSSS